MFMQIILFGLMIFTLVSFFSAVAYILTPRLTGVSMADVSALGEHSPRAVKDAFLLVQALTAIGIFLVPPLLFAYFAHPRPGNYLGLRQPGKSIHWALVIVIMLGATPVLLGIEALFRELHITGKMKEMQEQSDNAFKALLKMESFGDFVKTFLVIAVLPAISEELMFRGVVMRMAYARNRRIGVAIAISSFIFAAVHYNPVGLFAIFFAAVLLGGIYYLTGSIYMSMLAHFLNNGVQVFLMYLGNYNASVKAFADSDRMPLYFPVAGALVFAGGFYLLWKNRTPLPDDWSDDFKGERYEGPELPGETD